MAPMGVPWPSRGVPWPLYEEYGLQLSYYIYYPIQGQGQGHGAFELPTTSEAVHVGGDDRSPLAGLSGLLRASFLILDRNS